MPHKWFPQPIVVQYCCSLQNFPFSGPLTAKAYMFLFRRKSHWISWDLRRASPKSHDTWGGRPNTAPFLLASAPSTLQCSHLALGSSPHFFFLPFPIQRAGGGGVAWGTCWSWPHNWAGSAIVCIVLKPKPLILFSPSPQLALSFPVLVERLFFLAFLQGEMLKRASFFYWRWKNTVPKRDYNRGAKMCKWVSKGLGLCLDEAYNLILNRGTTRVTDSTVEQRMLNRCIFLIDYVHTWKDLFFIAIIPAQ